MHKPSRFDVLDFVICKYLVHIIKAMVSLARKKIGPSFPTPPEPNNIRPHPPKKNQPKITPPALAIGLSLPFALFTILYFFIGRRPAACRSFIGGCPIGSEFLIGLAFPLRESPAFRKSQLRSGRRPAFAFSIRKSPEGGFEPTPLPLHFRPK